MLDEKLLSIHQATVLAQWTLKQAIEGIARNKLGAISVWRDKLLELGVKEAMRLLDGSGLTVTGLSFAGLITSADGPSFAAPSNTNAKAA